MSETTKQSELPAALQARLRNFDPRREEYWRYSNLTFLKTLSPTLTPNTKPAVTNRKLPPQALIKESFFTPQEQQLLSFSCLKGESGANKAFIDCIPRLVFIDGYYEPQLSYLGESAAAPAAEVGGDLLFSNASGTPSGQEGTFFSAAEKNRLRQKAANKKNLLLELSAALHSLAQEQQTASPELFVRLRGASFMKKPLPLFLYFFTRSEDAHHLSAPRLHFLVEQKTEVTLAEFHCSKNAAAAAHTLLNFEIAAAATVRHACFQEEAKERRHVHHAKAHLGAEGVYNSYVYSLGAKTSVCERSVHFEGAGGRTALKGLYLMDEARHQDNLLSVFHDVPHCESEQLYQGILRGASEASFTGRVLVDKGAQKTSSEQLSKAILLGEEAVMNSRPELDIQADDVKCAHGATVGRLQEEDIFYLTSRGLSRKKAEALLSFACVNQFFSALKEPLPRVSPLLSERCFEQNFLE